MKGPQRIVCLTEETTEWLYCLGEQDRIVGISAYTVRPPSAKREKPVVSAFLSGSVKKIKDLRPDLVVGFSDIQAEFARELIAAGLQVLVTNQRSIDEIFSTMRWMAQLVSKEAEGDRLISEMRRNLDMVGGRAGRDIRPKVFFQEWDEPIISGIRWVSELIEFAGGEDCFRERRDAYLAKDRIVTAAEVASRSPDMIIGSWCGKPVDFEWVKSRMEWQSTSAIIKNHLYEMDPSIILQPGPALFLEGLQALEQIIGRFGGCGR